MTTTFPGSPKLFKGALVTLNSATSIISNTIPFQYNPETLTRTLQPQATSGEGTARAEALRLQGAPVETFKLDIELDATDRLEKVEPATILLGIHPQLAALETLVYPRSTQVLTNMQQAALGTIEIVPIEAPMTLLVWGVKRILPVRVTDFSITEEAYDASLNPIRAKVSLGLRVLNYADLPWGQRGAKLFLAHHLLKEQLGGKVALGQSAIGGIGL